MADDEQEVIESTGGPSLRERGCGLIGCLLVIVVLGGLGFGIFVLGRQLEPLADKYLWAPHETVRAYFEAYEDRDTERASRFLCDGIDGLLDPLQPFDRPLGGPHVDDEFPYPRPNGRLAIYYQLGLNGPRGQAMIEREDDGWRICEFTE